MYALYRLSFSDGARYYGVTDAPARRRANHERMAEVYAGHVNFSFEVLAEFETQQLAEQAEACAISQGRERGETLRNKSPGGRSTKGIRRSPRWRDRIGEGAKQVWAREGYREKMSVAHKGIPSKQRKVDAALQARLRVLAWAGGWQQTELAAEFGISQSTISNAIRGTYQYGPLS